MHAMNDKDRENEKLTKTLKTYLCTEKLSENFEFLSSLS